MRSRTALGCVGRVTSSIDQSMYAVYTSFYETSISTAIGAGKNAAMNTERKTRPC
jgi:hypothetical protein